MFRGRPAVYGDRDSGPTTATLPWCTREISGTYNGRQLDYDIAIPSDGTLVGRLSWPVETPGEFGLTLDGQPFEAESQEVPNVVGRLTVVAGRNYRASVRFWADYDPWNYFGTDPFVLVLSLE